jgi:hypothetical protein
MSLCRIASQTASFFFLVTWGPNFAKITPWFWQTIVAKVLFLSFHQHFLQQKIYAKLSTNEYLKNFTFWSDVWVSCGGEWTIKLTHTKFSMSILLGKGAKTRIDTSVKNPNWQSKWNTWIDILILLWLWNDRKKIRLFHTTTVINPGIP